MNLSDLFTAENVGIALGAIADIFDVPSAGGGAPAPGAPMPMPPTLPTAMAPGSLQFASAQPAVSVPNLFDLPGIDVVPQGVGGACIAPVPAPVRARYPNLVSFPSMTRPGATEFYRRVVVSARDVDRIFRSKSSRRRRCCPR